MSEREDIYAIEEQEYQSERNAWLNRNTNLAARVELERQRYEEYLAARSDAT